MLSGFLAALSLQLASVLPLALPLGAIAQPIHVTGRVLRDANHGLSGARVEIFPVYVGYAEAVRQLKTGAVEPAPLATALTDAEGRFDLAAPASGCFRLVVRSDGHLSMELPLVPLIEDTELAPVLLIAASPLEVQVVGHDGRPIPGVQVGIERLFGRVPGLDASPSWRPAGQRGISGKDGKMVLSRARGESPVLVALSPRFLGQRAAATNPGPSSVLRLLPRRAATLEARDATDRPVVDALVRWHGFPVAVTGPGGRLAIAVPAGDPLDVESTGGLARLTPQAGGMSPVRLEPPRRILGKVLDAARGEPVKGSLVWRSGSPVVPVVFSGADGGFQLDVLAGEDTWVESAAAGYLPGQRRFVKRGEVNLVLLALAPAAAISGVVVDPAGRPVATAQVGVDSRLPPFATAPPVRTSLEGRFRLAGLRPGMLYNLFATREGFARTKSTARTATVGQTGSPVRIVMDGGRTASGRVVGEDGRPVAGAGLFLFEQVGGMSPISRATADADGRFELRHLPSGRFALIADHPRHGRGHLEPINVPASGPAVDLGTVTLPDAVAIEGRVLGSRGLPIAAAEVGASPGLIGDGVDIMVELMPIGERPGRTGAVLTQADGGFRVEGLRRGVLYDVVARRAGYADASAVGVKVPTAEPVRIEMREARSLAGQVVGPEGEPVAGARLTRIQRLPAGIGLIVNNAGRELVLTDLDGRFQVTGLPPGTAEIAVEAEGYRTRRLGDVQIPEDRDLTNLKVALERASLLEVRVLSSEGEPVPSVMVQVQPRDRQLKPGIDISGFVAPGFTDLDGRCRLNVASGTYAVSAGTASQTAQRQVVAGLGITPVELRFPPGSEVSGRVVEEDGTEVAGAIIAMVGADSRQIGGRADGDGAFLVPGVADGSYRVTAQDSTSGRISDPLEVTVAGRPLRDLELRFAPKSAGATLTGHLLGLASGEVVQVGVVARLGSDGANRPGQVAGEGAYHVDDLTPGEWSVSAFLPSGRTAQGSVQIAPGTPAVTLDLEFPAGVTLSGHLRVDGEPLAGAMIRFLGANDQREERTAYDGSFTFRNVSPGPALLMISGPGGIGGSRTLQIAENEELAIDLSAGLLKGTVVGATGELVEDASVEATFLVPELQWSESFTSASSNAEGAFEMPRLAAGTYRILVRKNGFAPAEVTVEVQPGRDNRVEVRLKPLGAP